MSSLVFFQTLLVTAEVLFETLFDVNPMCGSCGICGTPQTAEGWGQFPAAVRMRFPSGLPD